MWLLKRVSYIWFTARGCGFTGRSKDSKEAAVIGHVVGVPLGRG